MINLELEDAFEQYKILPTEENRKKWFKFLQEYIILVGHGKIDENEDFKAIKLNKN